ncbi:MAG: 30S ribosomal protein S6 [Candidatus Puniceispirillales bacterium WSBS_2018_MAG_OTU23]
MRLYESVFIARQDISTGQVDAMCEEFAGIITDGGGKIQKQEYWGLKTLQYRIKKNRKGHYILFNMEADSATMAEYGRKLGLNEDVIRVLTVSIDEVDPEPSIMMQAKSDRPTREYDNNDIGDHERGEQEDADDTASPASIPDADAPDASEDKE